MIGALLAVLLLHPLHTTHTTIVAQADGHFTIEIRAFTDDLHAATLRHGGSVSDSLIAGYVRSAVRLTLGGQPVRLTWAGMTPDGDVTRLRLSGRIVGLWREVQLQQLMQTDLYEDQVNLVQVRLPERRLSFLFTPGDRFRPFT